MALLDLWNADRQQITGKRIDQLIAFAGEGRLRDGNSTSEEFRTLLKVVSSDVIGIGWMNALTFVHRLRLRPARYGQRSWSPLGFRCDPRRLSEPQQRRLRRTVADSWRASDPGRVQEFDVVQHQPESDFGLPEASWSPQLGVRPEDISILIVVGTEDTSDFEAQVRGSRFAWDIRLLGVKSLFRLLKLKEALDDPKVERQIQDILFPQEFTRLDRIIDLVFATAEDAQELRQMRTTKRWSRVMIRRLKNHGPISTPQFLPRLEKHFGQPLVKRSRSQWATPDDTVLVSCRVSKQF